MEFYRINAQMLPKVNFVDETEIRPPYVHRKRRAGEQILYFIRHGEMHLLEDGKLLYSPENTGMAECVLCGRDFERKVRRRV